MLSLDDCIEGQKVRVIKENVIFIGIVAEIGTMGCLVRCEESGIEGNYYLGTHHFWHFDELELIIEEQIHCTCHITMLITSGCKCGWIQKERIMRDE